jgi:hypothetical protein
LNGLRVATRRKFVEVGIGCALGGSGIAAASVGFDQTGEHVLA